jgi:hypothetical protein
VAPAKFLGNWATLDGIGALKWDQIIVSVGDAPDIVNASATIAGPGGDATYFGALHQISWTTFSAPINSASWSINSGTWNAILSNVTSLQIRIEAVHNDGPTLDVDGIDNVQLVPESGALTLFCVGSFIILALARRLPFRQTSS